MSNQSHNKQLLHVATLGKSIGLRGYMKLHIHSDFLEQFANQKSFYIDEKSSITFDIIKDSLVKLVGVSTPEGAKCFTNKKLYVTKEQTRESCKLKENQFFYFDIIGFTITQQAKKLGIIDDIERIGSVDYLIIKTNQELVTAKFSKSFLIPYIKKFIIKVDVKYRTIEVHGGFEILEAS